MCSCSSYSKSLKLHGNADPKELSQENLNALEDGLPNLLRHLKIYRNLDIPTVVALNRFPTDTENEIKKVIEVCKFC